MYCQVPASAVSDQDFKSKCARQWTLAKTMGTRDLTSLKILLARPELRINEVYSTDRETANALFMAVENGWILGLKLLVQYGAHINQQVEIIDCLHSRARRFLTPLMIAVANHHSDLVRTILDLGGDVTLSDPITNVNPLYIASQTNQPCTLAYLISHIGETCDQDEIFKLINAITTDFHPTCLSTALGNMGFGHETIFPTEPFTLLNYDRYRQEKALDVIKILLTNDANMVTKVAYLLPLPFQCSTVNNTRVLSIFLHNGLDADLSVQPSKQFKEVLPFILTLEDKLSLVTFYIHANYFKAVLLLVNAGCHLKTEDKMIILGAGRHNLQSSYSVEDTCANVQCLKCIVELLSKVQPLLCLARKATRRACKTGADTNIKKLPMPSLLKDYICCIET